MATILELPLEDLPRPGPGEDPGTGWTISRWLGGFGLGLVPVARAETFSWPGPWIARWQAESRPERRAVVMYGVPSGVVWDPTGAPPAEGDSIVDGFLIAATDIALALPPRPEGPISSGTIETICIASGAGAAPQLPGAARTIAGQGLAGDRHALGMGTFPSGVAGSALTLIEAEVCESFQPALGPEEHRRNLVTRGIDLNGLVGREFRVGAVRCRGMRLCEPCTVVDGYARRPVLRELVHRGGLRADILEDGEIRLGDVVRVL